jgi:hypothetical protein
MGTKGMVVAGAAAVGALVAGCGDDRSAGPERGVTVDEVQENQYFYEGEYLGQVVTVSGAVTKTISNRTFEIDGEDYGEDSLLVITAEPVAVAEGDVLRVTGTVGQYHRVMESEEPIYNQSERYEKYETEAVLHDASVHPLPPS